MFRVAAPLMACLLAIHALLGCCWHHAHDELCTYASGHAEHACCDREHDEHVLADMTRSVAHQPGDEQPGDSDPQHSDDGDCEGVCTFLRGKCVQVDAPEAAGVVQSLVGFSADHDRGSAGPTRFVTHPPSLHPPLRLHLVHQVLVI